LCQIDAVDDGQQAKRQAVQVQRGRVGRVPAGLQGLDRAEQGRARRHREAGHGQTVAMRHIVGHCHLVGPDALTGTSVAKIWSAALGRQIAYGGDDVGAFEGQMASFGPTWLAYDMRLMMGSPCSSCDSGRWDGPGSPVYPAVLHFQAFRGPTGSPRFALP
jgi:uncharacterized protein YbjT (DUF2867 family)